MCLRVLVIYVIGTVNSKFEAYTIIVSCFTLHILLFAKFKWYIITLVPLLVGSKCTKIHRQDGKSHPQMDKIRTHFFFFTPILQNSIFNAIAYIWTQVGLVRQHKFPRGFHTF